MDAEQGEDDALGAKTVASDGSLPRGGGGGYAIFIGGREAKLRGGRRKKGEEGVVHVKKTLLTSTRFGLLNHGLRM